VRRRGRKSPAVLRSFECDLFALPAGAPRSKSPTAAAFRAKPRRSSCGRQKKKKARALRSAGRSSPALHGGITTPGVFVIRRIGPVVGFPRRPALVELRTARIPPSRWAMKAIFESKIRAERPGSVVVPSASEAQNSQASAPQNRACPRRPAKHQCGAHRSQHCHVQCPKLDDDGATSHRLTFEPMPRGAPSNGDDLIAATVFLWGAFPAPLGDPAVRALRRRTCAPEKRPRQSGAPPHEICPGRQNETFPSIPCAPHQASSASRLRGIHEGSRPP